MTFSESGEAEADAQILWLVDRRESLPGEVRAAILRMAKDGYAARRATALT